MSAPQFIWPVFEFRPREKDLLGIVLRYADGAWIADDGEHDLAFIAYGSGAPMAFYVRLPYQRNIIWSGLTQHWRGHDRNHPHGNPWHYMLREGATEWGGHWPERDWHPNEIAGRKAMNECSRRNRCANGRGPEFNICDPYIVLGLVRDRGTKEAVSIPDPVCMYCGDKWLHALVEESAKARGEVA